MANLNSILLIILYSVTSSDLIRQNFDFIMLCQFLSLMLHKNTLQAILPARIEVTDQHDFFHFRHQTC